MGKSLGMVQLPGWVTRAVYSIPLSLLDAGALWWAPDLWSEWEPVGRLRSW